MVITTSTSTSPKPKPSSSPTKDLNAQIALPPPISPISINGLAFLGSVQSHVMANDQKFHTIQSEATASAKASSNQKENTAVTLEGKTAASISDTDALDTLSVILEKQNQKLSSFRDGFL